VLEDGRLTDGHGRTVDFRNTVIIMTSNIGTAEFERTAIGFQSGGAKASDEERHRTAVMDALKKSFRPEFLNRVDDFVVFHQLTQAELGQIVELMVDKVRDRLHERSIGIELTQAAKDWLVDEGFDPAFGARPLRRAVERHIENEIAKRVLSGEFADGDTVDIDAADGKLTFAKHLTANQEVSA
jgi:ATP-dependent Clp protease ATP-binding subunit ClpC